MVASHDHTEDGVFSSQEPELITVRGRDHSHRHWVDGMSCDSPGGHQLCQLVSIPALNVLE